MIRSIILITRTSAQDNEVIRASIQFSDAYSVHLLRTLLTYLHLPSYLSTSHTSLTYIAATYQHAVSRPHRLLAES